MASRKKTSDLALTPVPSAISEKQYAERERKYRAEDAIRTLTRAEEIRKDKGLMRDVKSEAKRISKTLSTFTAARKRP